MTNQPSLVPRDALRGVRVALSVSASADLSRLGLSESHLDLVVAEVTRAVVLAGGIILYGGRLRPSGFTQVIMEEIRRYGDDRQALEIYVPFSEHRGMSLEDLGLIDARLGMSGALNLVSASGQLLPAGEEDIRVAEDTGTDEDTLTSMRRLVSSIEDARLVLGGKLVDFSGSEPGVLEEARLTLEESKRLYVAGGFGGAGAALARKLDLDGFDWAPTDFRAARSRLKSRRP